MTRNYLKEKNINFTDIDVSKDQNAAKEAVAKNGQMAVPIIDIEGQIIVGFQKDLINQALGI